MPAIAEPVETPAVRERKTLTKAQQKIADWVRVHPAVLSNVARELGVSVQFVHRVAYNRDAKSRGLKVERKLKELGCPLIQKIA
jgi:hypothetical protein